MKKLLMTIAMISLTSTGVMADTKQDKAVALESLAIIRNMALDYNTCLYKLGQYDETKISISDIDKTIKRVKYGMIAVDENLHDDLANTEYSLKQSIIIQSEYCS